MQTKKEEIRQDIIRCATHEFVKKGYKKSSLRTIATKARPTLGNLYNYFPNKESILDEVVGHVLQQVEEIINNHNDERLYNKLIEDYNRENYTDITVIDKNNYHLFIDDLVKLYFPLDILISDPVIILLEECDITKYRGSRYFLIEKFTEHGNDSSVINP